MALYLVAYLKEPPLLPHGAYPPTMNERVGGLRAYLDCMCPVQVCEICLRHPSQKLYLTWDAASWHITDEGEMKAAISMHFAERNQFFDKNPRPAGKKMQQAKVYAAVAVS